MNVMRKNSFLYLLDKYRESKTDENRVNMMGARSDYKILLRKCRFEFDQEKKTKNLLVLKLKTLN